MAETFPLDLIESLAMEVDTFKNTSNDLERNCWLTVHRFQHGVLPSEYDIREIPEDLVAIRAKNQSESMKWRRQVREQFLAAFEKNGKVVGFSANNEYVVRI